MDRIVELTIEGQPVKAIDIDFEIKTEPWSEYSLLDGGTVRVKTIVHRILWLLDGDGQKMYDAEGMPSLAVRHRAEVVSSQ